MDAEHRQRVEELFEAALERPVGERAAWLAAACADDAELIREVESLVAAHEREEGILDGSALQAIDVGVSDPILGRSLGPYRIIRELAHGGMAVVYLAERDDGQFRRRVAVKVIRGRPDSEELHRRFEAERHILAALDHPNIARLLDGGITGDGRPYLVMEYAEGSPIDEYCDSRRLSIDDRLRLFCTAARAVHHAHRNLVVHRDIKPSNIFVTGDGFVKLLDFGIAKILDPSAIGHASPQTRTGLGLMTPEYASPEQVGGHAITTATDVYGLGVVLYELLTGARPFQIRGLPLAEWVEVVAKQEPLPPSQAVSASEPRGIARATDPERLRRRLRGELDRIVLMALRKEPERRYGSAEQFADDVERHLMGRPVAAHEDSRWYRTRKFIGRHRVESIAAAIVTVSLLVGSGLALWQASLARRERDRARAARAEAEEALAQSEDVTSFVIGLFEQSDPNRALTDTVAARAVLSHGLAEAERLSSQPRVQARMLEALGGVYTNLGQYNQAERLLIRALNLRLSEYGGDHPEVAKSLNSIGQLFRRRGRYAVGEALFRRALTIQEVALGPEHPDVAETLSSLAFLLPYEGRLEETLAAYNRALAVRRASLGPDHPLVSNSLLAVGATLRRLGRIDEAEAAYREALALRSKLSGIDHPATAAVMFHIADLLHEYRNQDAEAETLYRDGLAILTRQLGAEHPDLIHGLQSLATLLSARGDHAEAEKLYRQALAIHMKIYGSEHPTVAGTLDGLGRALVRQGRYQEALAVYERAQTVWRKAFGPEHLTVAGNLFAFGELYQEMGDYTTAERYFREALEMRRQVVGPDHPLVAWSLNALARLSVLEGEYREAEILLFEALANARKNFEARHPNVRAIHLTFYDLYRAWGKTQAAERHRALAAAE